MTSNAYQFCLITLTLMTDRIKTPLRHKYCLTGKLLASAPPLRYDINTLTPKYAHNTYKNTQVLVKDKAIICSTKHRAMNACKKTEADCTYSKVWPYMGISYRLGRLTSDERMPVLSAKKKKLVGPQKRCANLSKQKKKISWPCRQTSYDFSADHYTRLAIPATYTKYEPVFGYAVAQLVEALCYKPEGRGFDSR
jgi:hypothetical protein